MKNKYVMMTESAVMLALASVLSMVKILDLPYGGSVTACSMLPVILISYRHGLKHGFITALAYGAIQMLLGLDNLSYATSSLAVVLIILFDYLVAFLGLCVSGFFTKRNISQSSALSISVVVSGLIRYLCHFTSGYVVWRDLTLPQNEAIIYSFAYNAVYMIPEIIITSVVALYLSNILDFRSKTLHSSVKMASSTSKAGSIFFALSGLSAVVTCFIEVITVFPYLQSESGVFSLSGIYKVNTQMSLSILFLGVAVTLALFVVGKVVKNRSVKN